MSEVAGPVRRLARWIDENMDELADHVLERVRRELPDQAAQDDPALEQVARASAIANLRAISVGLNDGRMVPEQLPPGAVEQALTMANRNVAWTTVFRRHTFGHAELWDRILEEVDGWDVTPAQRTVLLQVMSRYLFAYRDYIATELTKVYQAQRERLVRSHEYRRIGLVREVLDGVVASEQELGYRLRAHHVGLVAWGLDPEGVVRAVAERHAGELLFVPGAARSLWAWCGHTRAVEEDALQSLEADGLPAETSVAIGAPAFGVEGFARTHREAMQSFRVGVRDQRRVMRDGPNAAP